MKTILRQGRYNYASTIILKMDNPVKNWFSTESLTEARKEYARLLSALKKIKIAGEIMGNFKTKCNENNN